MPNHITTRIKITGDPEAVKRVLNKIKNDEFGMGTIDFEKIIPMPKNIFKGNLGVENGNCTAITIGMTGRSPTGVRNGMLTDLTQIPITARKKS